MAWLVASATACAVFLSVVSGIFVPLRDAAGVEYLFAWPGAVPVVVSWAAAFLVLGGLRQLAMRLCAGRTPDRMADARSAAWLAPLTGLAAIVAGVLPAVPGVGQYGAPAAYVFYDLRWWWCIGLAGWSLLRADALLGAPLASGLEAFARSESVSSRIGVELLLAVTVSAWAIATTPNLRFIGVLHGDEPKYVRYCEVWYQGGGADISQKTPFSEQPLDAPPRVLHAIAGAAHATIQEAQLFAGDLRQFASDPRGFRWIRATGDNGFVHGKHGGVYQIHEPGTSAVLMPGYFVDRYLIGLNPGYNDEFPDQLPMTSFMMLLSYVCCALALFRLLVRALDDRPLAWVWAAIGAMTMPTTAFAFQLYPELPAAAVVVAVTAYALFPGRQGSTTAAIAGAAAAALTWLHPRFLAVAVCLLVAALLQTRSNQRRWFATAFAVVLLGLAVYDYRITGSPLPTSLWDVATPDGALHASAMPLNLVAYGLDREWGLAPQAPWLLALLPGLALLVRRTPGHALALLAIGLALAIPASGHTIHAAGGTPGRLVLAVVPLAIWPVALLAREFWRVVPFRIGVVAAVVLSLDAGLAYNVSHKKHVGPMRDISISGWKPNLAFPVIRDTQWDTSWSNFWLFLAIAAVIVIATLVVWFLTRRAPGAPLRPAGDVRWWTPLAGAALLVLAMTGATAANGLWSDEHYTIATADAHQRAAVGLVAQDRCALCFTSRRPAVDWRELEPNGATGLRLDADHSRRAVTVHVALDASPDVAGFGRIRIEFGDGTATGWEGIVSAAQFQHRYSQTGTYTIAAWLQLRDGSLRVERTMVTLAADQGA
jgi:hypothetical protein